MNMTESLDQRLLFWQIQKGLAARMLVKGISMLPTLKTGDIITVRRQKDYDVGDIIVFCYHHSILVHRIVEKNDNAFCCKGDNAYGCELVAAEKVLGKIIAANDEKICVWPARLIELSLMAADAFKMCHYDIESVKNTLAYLRYQKMLHLYEECGHNENVFLVASKEDR